MYLTLDTINLYVVSCPVAVVDDKLTLTDCK